MDEIQKLLADNYSKMSKTQKKISDYILENVNIVSFMTVEKLAIQTEVSEASIIRFCTFLGLKGFPQLKEILQNSMKQQLSIQERLRISYDAYDDKELGIVEVFNQDIVRIQETLNKLDMDIFFKSCHEIIRARNIYIISARSAMAPAMFFQYYLNIILGNVYSISNIDSSADVISTIDEHDVVIGLTFKRYSQSTVNIMNYVSKKKATTIAITDSPVSPIVKSANYCLLTDTSMPTYLDSLVSPLTLINAILTYIGRQRNVELERRLDQLEDLWENFHVFQ